MTGWETCPDCSFKKICAQQKSVLLTNFRSILSHLEVRTVTLLSKIKKKKNLMLR